MDPVLYIADTVRPERFSYEHSSLVEDWTNQENIARLVDKLSKDTEQAEAFAGALSSALDFMKTDYIVEIHSRGREYDSFDRILSLAMRLPLYSAELDFAALYLDDGPLSSSGQIVRESIEEWQAQYDALEEMVVGWFVTKGKGSFGKIGKMMYNHRLTPRLIKEKIGKPVKKGIQNYDPLFLTITALTKDK